MTEQRRNLPYRARGCKNQLNRVTLTNIGDISGIKSRRLINVIRTHRVHRVIRNTRKKNNTVIVNEKALFE